MLAQNTTLCYLERDGAWLMMHRVKKQNDCNHDKWIGVGGKFEACESPEECLLREVKEETGVTLTRWRYRGIITFVLDGVGEYMHLFTADRWEGEPACGDSDEGVLEWVPREKVPALPIWEGDKLLYWTERNCKPKRKAPACRSRHGRGFMRPSQSQCTYAPCAGEGCFSRRRCPA